MFTAADFRLIRKNCLSDLESLLKNLSINLPNFDNGDEFKIYSDLDKEITEKICRLMKSSTVIDGYTKLLKLGDISYSYSETDDMLLDKIIMNGNIIVSNLRNVVRVHEKWSAEWGNEKIEVLSVDFSNAEPFNKSRLTSKFEQIKYRLQRNFSQSPFEGLERIISMAGTVQTKYLVAGKLLEFLEAIFDIFDSSKKENLNTAYDGIDECIRETNQLGKLIEIKDTQRIRGEDIGNLIAAKTSQMSDGESKIICLKVSKNIEWQEKKVPPEPPTPKFNQDELEGALKILEQVNKIKKSI